MADARHGDSSKNTNADKYCTFTFTASAYRELFSMLDEVSSDEWAKMIPTDLPVLVISGDEDPVGGFGKGVREVASRLTAAGLSDLTLKLIPGGRHEILNETDRTRDLRIYPRLDGKTHKRPRGGRGMTGRYEISVSFDGYYTFGLYIGSGRPLIEGPGALDASAMP